jgi:multiple sugar transport system permease protein
MSNPISTELSYGEKRPRDIRRFHFASIGFLAPAGSLLLLLFLGPVFYSFYLGLTDLQLIGPHSVNFSFTGIRNLQSMLEDKEFYHSLWVTLVFVLGSGAIGSTGAGLALAMLMQAGNAALRTTVGALAMLACILPPVTVATIWHASTTSGGVYPFLFGIVHADLLYQHPMLVVSLANIWWLCGLPMLMFSAALRNVSHEMLEAALLERASSWHCFSRILLPSIRPTVITASLLMCLLSFGNFTLIFLMTGGGPAYATNILPLYSYLQGFTFHRLGYGALLGDVIVLLSAALGIGFVLIGLLSERRSTFSHQGRSS